MNKFMDKFKKKKLLAFTLILVLILLIQSVSSLFTSSNLEDEVLLIYISFSLLLSITYSLSDESTLKEFFIIISGVIMFLIGCWLAFSFESLFNDWSFWVLMIVSPFMIIAGYVNLKRKKVGNPIIEDNEKLEKFSLKKIILWTLAFLVSMNLLMLLIFHLPFSSINNQNYYFERLDVAQLWEHSTGYGQTIAIIDSGITNEAMELFQDNILSVYNAIDGSRNVLDENEHAHGTQMASIIIAHGDAGVYGIAPSAQVIIIKAFEGAYSQTSGEALVRAVDYAIFQEVDIISMSFGSHQVNNDLEEAIERAIELGIIVVAATGDYGQRDSLFPARMEGVVSVRAKDYNGDFWRFSNIGANDVMSMYGVDILGLTFNNESIEMSGTSQATALAAGYIALIRDYHIRNGVMLRNEDIFEMLQYLDSNERQVVDYLSPFRFSFD